MSAGAPRCTQRSDAFLAVMRFCPSGVRASSQHSHPARQHISPVPARHRPTSQANCVGYVAHGYRHDPVADGGRYRDVPARAPRTNVAFRFLATGSKEVLIARDQYQHTLFSPWWRSASVERLGIASCAGSLTVLTPIRVRAACSRSPALVWLRARRAARGCQPPGTSCPRDPRRTRRAAEWSLR